MKLDRKQLEQHAQQEDATVGRMVSTPDGETGLKVMRGLFYDRISHNVNNPNALDTAFKEGQRSVVQYLLQCKQAIEEAADVTKT